MALPHAKVIAFTKSQLEFIETLIHAGEVAEGFKEMWGYLLGHSYDSHEGSINPSDYAIPQAQWSRIAKALIKEGGTSGGLMMVNIGPSAVE